MKLQEVLAKLGIEPVDKNSPILQYEVSIRGYCEDDYDWEELEDDDLEIYEETKRIYFGG